MAQKARRRLSPVEQGVTREQLPFECIALLLQGGGALGAYQAGVYEALSEAGLEPDWVAGISIGAINAAIIAGNRREDRVEKLRSFWEGVTANPLLDWLGDGDLLTQDGTTRKFFNEVSAASTLMMGAAGFFGLRQPAPWLHGAGNLAATSYYDTKHLKPTLESLVDFDRLNSGETRMSVGAVNVRSGNFTYFDTTTHTIRPEHIMASGALPPGFPAVEIEGEHYWDGGLISNTPLQWVVASRQDTLAIQVDLWSARGDFPATLADVATRQKEIQYSSRTRAGTDRFKELQRLRHALARVIEGLPEELRNSEDVKLLNSAADQKFYNIVQIIYRSKQYEGNSKDYEFSRLTMKEHWRSGYNDAVRTLRHPEILARPENAEGVFTFDLAENGRE